MDQSVDVIGRIEDRGSRLEAAPRRQRLRPGTNGPIDTMPRSSLVPRASSLVPQTLKNGWLQEMASPNPRHSTRIYFTSGRSLKLNDPLFPFIFLKMMPPLPTKRISWAFFVLTKTVSFFLPISVMDTP